MSENFHVKGGLIYFGRNRFARLIKAGTDNAVTHMEQEEAVDLLNDSDILLQRNKDKCENGIEYEPLD